MNTRALSVSKELININIQLNSGSHDESSLCTPSEWRLQQCINSPLTY